MDFPPAFRSLSFFSCFSYCFRSSFCFCTYIFLNATRKQSNTITNVFMSQGVVLFCHTLILQGHMQWYNLDIIYERVHWHHFVYDTHSSCPCNSRVSGCPSEQYLYKHHPRNSGRGTRSEGSSSNPVGSLGIKRRQQDMSATWPATIKSTQKWLHAFNHICIQLFRSQIYNWKRSMFRKPFLHGSEIFKILWESPTYTTRELYINNTTQLQNGEPRITFTGNC